MEMTQLSQKYLSTISRISAFSVFSMFGWRAIASIVVVLFLGQRYSKEQERVLFFCDFFRNAGRREYGNLEEEEDNEHCSLGGEGGAALSRF